MPHDLCPKLYVNVYISWKLFCVREIISQKVKNEIFVLCPELTGVEQYFRNGEKCHGKLYSIFFPTDTNLSVMIRYKRSKFTDEKKCLQHGVLP